MSSEPVVEFKNVTYRIGDHGAKANKIANVRPLVSDLTFEVYRDETLVLLGRSGCGKTTTLKLINRLLTPSEGEVYVEGVTTTEWDAIKLRRRIGYVIQEVGLFPHFTVEKNIGLVPSLEGWDPTSIRRRVCEMLDLVGLEPGKFMRRYPRELSGGQRQRVGVARALAADPPILLMDEPFGALDPLTRAQLQKEFSALQQRLGKTVVFVTHDVREAFALASRIGLLKEGRLVALGPPDEFAESDDPEARAFIDCLYSTETAAEPQR